MTKITATYEKMKFEREHNMTLTFSEISDVINLIANQEIPDGHFSDNQCNIWEIIISVLDIDTDHFR